MKTKQPDPGPVIKSFAIVQVGNEWSAVELSIQDGKVVGIRELSAPSLKAVAVDALKVALVRHCYA